MVSKTTSKRAGRLSTGTLAGALVLLPLGACTFGSDTVSCSTSSCTVTLSGNDAEVEILGTTLAFGGVQDGRATLSVGNASVSCAEGETVSAGPLSLECTSVQDDSVKLTASLG
ncbi:hypothetical protein [Geodermatophilus ruber]|uniref:Uncharacterized protein n=1 Tax=Geodermatophilus ruber TaxID=504800 RepID=A0A1I3Z0D4_9ACTN|nr:hypothetical protein [Geodermatophilus ruber]SFK37572.1 hypothetical protein SAMN04488085_101286 [Geodermatophilus ruber]